MKQCLKCKSVKPIRSFNKNRNRKDGLQAVCRECNLKAVREWAIRNPEKRRAQHRLDYLRHGRRATKNCSPEKRRAHKIVDTAIRNGVLVRPDFCSVCNSSERKIHAHHTDYREPLQVIWLCGRCHVQQHLERTA